MELRTTEETVQELIGLYESLRQSQQVWSLLLMEPPVSLSDVAAALPAYNPEVPPAAESTADTDDDNETAGATATATATAPTTAPTSTLSTLLQWALVDISDLATAAEALRKIQTTLVSASASASSSTNLLPTKMNRFRKRLAERDPITQKPRYGAQTQRRVQVLVQAYDFLTSVIPMMEMMDNTTTNTTTTDDADMTASYDSTTASTTTTTTTSSQRLLWQLQQRHTHQLSSEQLAQQQAERLQKQQLEEARQEALRREQEEAAERERLAQIEQQQKEEAEAELRRLAEAARQRRLASERAEQEWVDGIVKGPQGVRIQLEILKESCTSNSKDELATAITSLHTLFRQINAHPEETQFRRIKRTHEQFVQDIGRHKGGVEVLMAAGFTVGAIDDVPCYLSKEPNLETDMDGWSAWFDLNKATLEILEDELQKLPK
jgi:hypothetical protein